MKFRNKPLVIDAVRWRGYLSNLGITSEPADQPVEITLDNMNNINWESIPDWLPKPLRECQYVHGHRVPSQPGEILRGGDNIYIGTQAGETCAAPGDWIIRGVKGEIYPCKPDVFAATYSGAIEMTDAQIKHMVKRFLGWRLPENFNPDAGISFKPTFNEHMPFGPQKHEPTGTSLFDAQQAEAMVRYMIEGMG